MRLRRYKIIIQFQIAQETVLFSKLVHFMRILFNKKSPDDVLFWQGYSYV